MLLEKNTGSNQNTSMAPAWTFGMRAPNHPVREVEEIVKLNYGMDARLSPLAGERDQNFLISADGFDRCVLKIGCDADGSAVAEYQSALLSYLEEAAPDLPLPRNILNKQGEAYTLHRFENGDTGSVRLVSYLEGQPVSGLKQPAEDWAAQAGTFQGRLCRALTGFDHEGATAFIPWHSSSAAMFGPETLAYLQPDMDGLVAPHLERLLSTTLPALQKLRHQVIHNDLHPGNVMMDGRGRISGIIDFGDAIRAPVLQDVAVSVSSLIEFSPAGYAGLVSAFLKGFCSVFPLLPEERVLFQDALLLRSILNVALGRVKDQFAPPEERPRPATVASEKALRVLLSLCSAKDWFVYV